jgi:hypothetical protein
MCCGYSGERRPEEDRDITSVGLSAAELREAREDTPQEVFKEYLR